MTKLEQFFPSADGKNQIAYTVWIPDSTPRGIVQIVHGMTEYVDRYEDLARFFCENGLVVCGDDHLGHGRTAACDEDLGYFGATDGDRFLVEDAYSLQKLMRKKYRSLPYILLGHSMGSFITRALISVHPEIADAVILSGTAGGGQPLWLGKMLCTWLTWLHGDRYRSRFLSRLSFWGYNKRFKGSTGCEWVCSDLDNIRKYASDKWCTFTFTVSAYRDLFTLLEYVNSDEWYDKMPLYLPILLVSGSEDPVGNYTKGIDSIVDKLSEREFSDVECLIYEGERHEVHNGLKRDQVYHDLLNWIDRVLQGVIEAKTQSIQAFHFLNTDNEEGKDLI
jgi:alpha-beta hydrolase superfamily lysophospholipase